MEEDGKGTDLGNVIRIDDERVRDHLGRIVRGTVEETLNAMLVAEADRLCDAGRYVRTAARRDQQSGSFESKLQTKAGQVTLKVPKRRVQTFETAIIERYRRRESSVEEASRCIWPGYRFVESRTSQRRCGEDLPAAQRKAAEVIARPHSMRLGKAAELVETAVPETLAYYAFSEEHWRRIRTHNPLERIMRDARLVGAFLDGNSALNLAAARLRHIAGTRWSTQ